MGFPLARIAEDQRSLDSLMFPLFLRAYSMPLLKRAGGGFSSGDHWQPWCEPWSIFMVASRNHVWFIEMVHDGPQERDMPKQPAPDFKLRIPADVRLHLKAKSQEQQRSMGAHIVFLLRQEMEKEKASGNAGKLTPDALNHNE